MKRQRDLKRQRNLKQRWTRGALLSGLLLVGLAPAQREVSIYGGVFRGTQAVNVEVYAPAGTVFTLRRVLDPAVLFAASPDPHEPKLSAANLGAPIRSVKLGSRDQNLSFGKLPSGVYVVGTGKLGAVVMVSNLGLVVKRDAGQALTYTADRESGKTQAAKVWALGSGSPVTASADGVARFVKKASEDETYLARFGNDWAISGANWNSYAAPLVRGYVYTDRPVYRPGQHVEFKAVLRQAGKLTPLAKTAVRVTINSPDGDEVYRKTLTTNALGSLNAGLDLPVGTKLGGYSFSLLPDGADGDGQADVGGSFQVEAYQKPEYAVTLSPDRKRAVQGEKVSIRISARYLFGGNVSGARVNYNVTRAPYYPPGFDSTYLPPDGEGSDYGSDLVVQEETRLNAGGDLDLTLPLERDPDGQPISYRIEAEVEDQSRRTVSAQTQVIAFPASVNVEATTDGYVYDAGKPIRVSLDTRDLKEVGQAAPVTLELIRQSYDYDKKKKTWVVSESRLSRSQVTTNAGGTASTTLSSPRGGGFLVRATVRDAQGRSSIFENFVWVLKPGEDYGWNYRDLTVQLDRKTYAAGDTATVLVGNPKPGAPVLVTLEGDKLRNSIVLRGTGAVLTYRFPVTADMAPNIYVAAATLSDGQFYSNDKQVKVPRVGAALTVKITPAKARYAPGDTGKFSVDVKAADGKGVAGEVALGVVDGAIYLVKRDDSTPIAQVFDAPRSNAVGTNSSLNFYFSQVGNVAAAPSQSASEPAFAQDKSGASAAPSGSEVTPRQDFRDTILWVPNLLTDAQGHAEVEVKFPDNLTTLVATARAQTAAPRFGQSVATTITTKDVIARLSLPPFLVRGDTVTLSGIVNNTLNKAVTGTGTASVNGLLPLGGDALKPSGAALKVTANGRVRTDMQVRAGNVGTANVTFTARTASGNDALKLPLPIKARGYEVTQTGVGSAASPSIKLNIPADANLKTLDLSLSLTPSLLSAVSPALEFLVGYPYGCTEQTMSRFLPALLAKQNLGSAALPQSVAKNLPDIVSAGLARLELFQHEDGGWNFWQYDDSTLEMSAYVVEGLLRAKGLGVKIDNTMLDSGLKYLSRNVNNAGLRQAERARAFRALAAAGRVNATQLAAFSRRKDLEPYALAQTAMALNRSGQAQAARDVLDRLKAGRIGTNNGALIHWETPKQNDRNYWYDYWDDNSVQVTATALEAIAELEPNSALVPGVSQWLLGNRRGPKWLSTQDTTSAIIAALALKHPKTVSGEVSALLDGKTAGQATLSGQEAATLKLDASALKTGTHTVTLRGAPAGLTFSTQLKYSREPAELKGDASKGLRLGRQYVRLEPVWDAKKKAYTYRRVSLLKGGQMQPVTVGDLILVTLSVQPVGQSARYMVVSDPIPAGMKALDERSLAIAGLQDPDEYGWDDWNYWYAGRDLLDDRVDLYADYLKGQQKMTYLLRAQTPGTFTALPTHAFLMYDPDVEGYAPATTFTVRDRGQ